MPRNNPFSLWMETAIAMNAAGVTIAMRLMKMNQAMLAGDWSRGPEASRMVAEKMTVEKRVTAAVAAGVRPGFKKARANARRLTRLR